MTYTPETPAHSDGLEGIVDQLRQLTEAVREQNELLRSCVLRPDDNPARFMVGMYGPLEVLKL